MTDLPASGDVLGPPAPVLSPALVTALVREVWGLRADAVRPLTSERDLNILVDGRYVLKVSNPAEDPAVVDMENTAMAHAARIAPGLPVPSVVRTAAGASVACISDDADEACLARLVTVVPGTPAEGRPVTTDLPAGLNHADVTLTNILTDGRSRITGLVDFGDLHHTAHACDLAVALTSVLRNTAGQQPAGTWDPAPWGPPRILTTCSGAAAWSPAARSARCSTPGRCISSAAKGRGCSPPTAPGTSTPTTTSPSSGTPIPRWRRR